jgi:hypothetical protein
MRVLSVEHRAQRQLRMAGNPDLADEKQVEGRFQYLRHLEADRHAASGERQYDRLLRLQVKQGTRQPPSGIGSISEQCH